MGRKRNKVKRHRQAKKRRRQTKTKSEKALYLVHVKNFTLKLKKAGLQIVEIAGDGNCLFRAISHQMTETDALHLEYRAMWVSYLHAHQKEFEGFLEQDFGEYVSDLSKEGYWGGNMELYVLAHVLEVNIVAHRLDAPNSEILPFPESQRCLHLSYHLGQHYNSIVAVDGSQLPLRPYEEDEEETKSWEDQVLDYLQDICEGKSRETLQVALKSVFPDELPALDQVYDQLDEVLEKAETLANAAPVRCW